MWVKTKDMTFDRVKRSCDGKIVAFLSMVSRVSLTLTVIVVKPSRLFSQNISVILHEKGETFPKSRVSVVNSDLKGAWRLSGKPVFIDFKWFSKN